MPTSSPLDGRIVRSVLEVVVKPPPGTPSGHTESGVEFGKRLKQKVGDMALDMAGDGAEVTVKEHTTVY